MKSKNLRKAYRQLRTLRLKNLKFSLRVAAIQKS
jgi:hypothetical protein